MNKKLEIIILSALLAFAPKPSAALLSKAIEEAYNTIPVSPVINFGQDIVETGRLVTSNLANITSLAAQIQHDVNSTLLSMRSSFNAIGVNINYESELGNAINSTICATPVSSMNIGRVGLKMRDTLLLYNNPSEKLLVDANRRSFYMDNIYNIYASIQLLKQAMRDDGPVGKAIITTRQCCVEGQGSACGIPATTDGGGNEMLYSYGYALATLDNVVKMWERVAALKAQLKALQVMMAIEILITPEDADDSSQDISLAPFAEMPVFNYQLNQRQTIASAQVLYKNAAGNLTDLSEIDDTSSEDNSTGSPKWTTMQFSVPAAVENTSPLIENASKISAFGALSEVEEALQEAAAAHNFIKGLDKYKETAQQYKDMLEHHAKKLNLLTESNQCGTDYVKRYFQNYDAAWSGQKFTLADINQYDLRKGISGWALDAYDVAKAAQTSVEVTDDGQISYADDSSLQNGDMETETLDTEGLFDQSKGADLEGAETQVKKLTKGTDGKNGGNKVGATASQKTQDENRRATMISWQIGAEAAKVLSADPQKWGTPTNQKFIWNDTKIFYNQYLRRKYSNIKSYLKRYTKADVVDIFISKLQDADLEIGQTEYQTRLNELYYGSESAIAALIAQNNKDMMTVIPAALLEKRQKIVDEIDYISKQIKDLSDEVSDISAKSEDDAFQSRKAAIDTGDFSEDNDIIPELPTYAQAVSDVSKANSQNLAASNIKELQALIEQKKASVEAFQSQLDEVDEEIREAKLAAQEQGQGAASKLNIGLRAVVNAFSQDKKSAYEQYVKAVDERFTTALSALSGADAEAADIIRTAIDAASGEVIEALNAAIDQAVDYAYAEIQSLGDELYLPHSSSQVNRVAEIHRQMIDELKALTIAKSVMGYDIIGMVAFADLELLDTSPETEGFFVGALPRGRDLKAPMTMDDFSQPPVREIFHFDSVDFANVKPYTAKQYERYKKKRDDLKEAKKNLLSITPAGMVASLFEKALSAATDKKKKAEKALKELLKISRGDFLNCGSEIPAIWKLMLQDNAFIEARFDLQDALNQGCEPVAFLRGGIFPCRVEDSSTVMDINLTKQYDDDLKRDVYEFDMDEAEYVERSDIKAAGLPKCLLMRMKKGNPYLTIQDDKVNMPSTLGKITAGVSELLGGDKVKPVEQYCRNYSELGMILDADEDNNLSFKPTVYETFNNLFAAEAKNSKKLKKKEKNQIALAAHAELSRNQIGDFLGQVEAEKKIKQNLDAMKEQYDADMAELKSQLSAFGFEVQDNYDISNANDYKITVDRLKQAKNAALEKTLAVLASVDVEDDNQPARERKAEIEKLINIMHKDTDGHLQISVGSNDGNNPEEELKTAKANKEASDKYRKKVKEENTGEYKDLEEAYCSNY